MIADVDRMLRSWNVPVIHPRYFGLFNPSVHEASVIADTMVAAFNPQLAAWSHSPAANEIERHLLQFLAGKIGYPPGSCLATFTSGGAEANQSTIITALTAQCPAYREEGAMALAAKPVLYASAESHHSFVKAAHAAGIGRQAVRIVEVDDQLRLSPSDLRRLIALDVADGLLPFAVIATAGTTSAGVVDPLGVIAKVCQEHGLWLHVDAAWGGAALLSPRLRACLTGIELADSVTWDAHKWLSVPMAAGMFFCRHPDSVIRTFGTETAYMPSATDAALDPYATSMQWSRRFIGLKLFMPLAELGASGLAELIEHQANMGDALRRRLGESGWRLITNTPLPVVCCTHRAIESGRVSCDQVLERIYQRARVWVSQVELAGGIRAIRACITSFRTNEEDLAVLIDELEQAIRS